MMCSIVSVAILA